MESVIFLLSSSLLFGLIYYKTSIHLFQQLTALVLLILLVILKQYVFNKQKKPLTLLIRFLLLFLSSMLFQLLVISSGGLLSPFLILLHLYALGSGFLLNLTSSISFLIFAVIVLLSQVYFDQNLHTLFNQDPGTSILYVVSFLVVIPLAQFLNSTYHVKDNLSRILNEHLQLNTLREKLITSGIGELVIVTDQFLKVISINETASKWLQKDVNEAVGQSLSKILILTDKNNQAIEVDRLPLDQIVKDRASRIITGHRLYLPLKKAPIEVVINISLVTDLTKKINQLLFVISEVRAESEQGSLEVTFLKHIQLVQDLKQALISLKLPQLKTKVDLLSHLEEDLVTALQMENKSGSEQTNMIDLVKLCQEIILKKGELANDFGVGLNFAPPPDKEALLITSSPVWLGLLIQKLIDLSLLLAQVRPHATINLSIALSGQEILLNFIVPFQIMEINLAELFDINYGRLSAVNRLSLGSGLEGLIAKTIADKLDMSLQTEVIRSAQAVVIKLKIPQAAQANN